MSEKPFPSLSCAALAAVDLRRRTLVLSGLAFVGSLTACGGGDDPEEAKAAEPSAERRSTEPGPHTYTLSNLPRQTFASNGQIRTIANPGGKTRPQAFAGQNSRGLLTSAGAACPASVLFGVLGESGFHRAEAELEPGGKDPDTIRVDSQAGRQWMAGQRLLWTAATRQLRMVCKAGDAPVGDVPRIQLVSHPVPNRAWLRFHCRFQLGDAVTPWPTGPRQGAAIFEFRGDGAAAAEAYMTPPAVALEIRDGTSGDATHVDVVLMRRGDPRAPEQEVCRVRGLARQVMHDFIVEIYPDWKAGDGGGALALLHDGQRVPLASGAGDRLLAPTVYGASAPDLYRGVWGIRRHRHAKQPAADDACIVWHRAEIEISDEPFDAPAAAPVET